MKPRLLALCAAAIAIVLVVDPPTLRRARDRVVAARQQAALDWIRHGLPLFLAAILLTGCGSSRSSTAPSAPSRSSTYQAAPAANPFAGVIAALDGYF